MKGINSIREFVIHNEYFHCRFLAGDISDAVQIIKQKTSAADMDTGIDLVRHVELSKEEWEKVSKLITLDICMRDGRGTPTFDLHQLYRETVVTG